MRRSSATALAPCVADLKGDAPTRHAVGPVDHPRRPAGVHTGGERPILAEIDQLSLEDPDFLPEVVRDRLRRLHAGVELEESRDVPGLEVAAQDPLGDPGATGAARARARHGLPGKVLRPEELELGLRHARLLPPTGQPRITIVRRRPLSRRSGRAIPEARRLDAGE